MKRKNWKIDEDKTQVNSITNIPIKWLDVSLQAWIEIEENQNWGTDKQITSFESFLNQTLDTKQELIQKLNVIYSCEFKKGRIEKTDFKNVLESINWKQSQICLPQLYNSENEYIFLLPETNWKIADSDYSLELEVLYTNGKIELIQEMSGLWNRNEWFEDYLKRKTSQNKV
ncbi:conserved protein of unknown function [Tenacibaculum sp. 190130A14a]|uniref:Uncharacterized protein n=1 Tax=Tenacibaculum polynesiense TaxID=3137857 RepID=A0ABP1ERZ8_9FLAO